MEEQTIVFGVSFMGESAKVLNPQERFLCPDAKARTVRWRMADEGDDPCVPEEV